MIRLLILLSVAMLAACSQEGRDSFAFVPEAVDYGTQVPVFVASGRDREGNGYFEYGRAAGISLSRYTVSVPPVRPLGMVTLASEGYINPRLQYVVSDIAQFDGDAAFETELASALGQSSSKTAVIFVPGFNISFREALYRQAQMMVDLQIPGVPVLFSWPSANNVLGYGFDRESILYSRNPLEKLIRQADAAGAEEVVVIGHSLGALLTMEVLRQMAIRDGGTPSVDFGGIILVSPDIDIELFRRLAEESGGLPEPFAIFVSKNDPALRISALLAGTRDRLGTNTDPALLGNLPVSVIDVSDFAFDNENLHFTAANSPALIRILTRAAMAERETPGSAGPVLGSVMGQGMETAVLISPRALAQ
ncbi:alpha/beta hydrolase [Pelagovum pacificum]|uniref:Alpha/beta fold hydrolase n=1 Tax=Pelagovum pacificum TaxID=2588711 RepID=A0A5C5GL09_9RHOB|nr:alpha/beta fold hydrolase [Pelagovum pacificum]QQA42766.1 alpha/beta fold hydrolase [Pelagovum pacificum]TNY34086.1 alpha/beta fold hydrolase [Pelagovum pacificum]